MSPIPQDVKDWHPSEDEPDISWAASIFIAGLLLVAILESA